MLPQSGVSSSKIHAGQNLQWQQGETLPLTLLSSCCYAGAAKTPVHSSGAFQTLQDVVQQRSSRAYLFNPTCVTQTARQAQPAAETDVCPVNAFEGPRPGWAFKAGPRGQGYYKDASASMGTDKKSKRRKKAESQSGPSRGEVAVAGAAAAPAQAAGSVGVVAGAGGGAGAGAGGIAASQAAQEAAGPAANGGATAGQLVAADSPGSGSEEEQNPMQPVQGELFRHTCPGQHSHPVLHSGQVQIKPWPCLIPGMEAANWPLRGG